VKKLAVFVEGYTELLFIEQLILNIGGVHNVVIELKKIRGGSSVPRRMTTIKAANTKTGQGYYILIIDCGSDDQVKTRIMEEHQNLTQNGYLMIIGLRDVRPKYSYVEIPKLEVGLKKYIKTSLIPVEFILAVMEIEAWFLAEFTHFEKIDPAITIEKIRQIQGFDPLNDDLSQRMEPANDLNASYNIGGKTYEKNNVSTTINVLDYSFIYLELKNKIHYLNRLINSIESFLT
jgi:hypothetical protein